MKRGKAVGPDGIPVEVWTRLGEMGLDFLVRLFNYLLNGKEMPKEWRRSVLVPVYKNKGDAQSCNNYRGIKLMAHTNEVVGKNGGAETEKNGEDWGRAVWFHAREVDH